MAAAIVNNSENETKMFGPLLFDDGDLTIAPHTKSEIICLLCDAAFDLKSNFVGFVKHLFEEHQLVVEDVQHIDNLPAYLEYWRNAFKSNPIEEIVPTVRISATNRLYFVLSTLLKEDSELRHKLRLEHVLTVQEFERTDRNYSRLCLFCKLNFKGTRAEFVQHLIDKHNLQLGNPQNLVHIEELVDKIDETLNKLTCIFCNRTFPERNVLKEHMRKKLHKRLNRRNTHYDKYFIVNYLELETKSRPKPDNVGLSIIDDEEKNEDEDYNDWNEKEDSIICLFCEKRDTNINTLCLHMEADHDFDFSDLTHEFDFYQKVKFVNYVRHQVHNKKCLYCNLNFASGQQLQTHLFEEQHCLIPDVKIFDQPEYYFPTYENDAFLYLIDDVED